MFRFLLLFSLALLSASIQWQSTVDESSWKYVFVGMRSEFLPEEIKEASKDPLFAVPLDLQAKIPESGTVILVDFRLPSSSKRLWVVRNKKVMVHCRVAHGKNSGELITEHFSNDPETNMSCFGEFRTGKIYQGEKGLAMRLHGLEPGVNDNAYARGIVFHGGSYASYAFLAKHGRIGRSLGCFVTEPGYNARIIRLCRFGAKMFVSGHQPVKF
ncbi:MAG: murein L,D-transpeptidase catalytic domain family protein [Crocinitomicaceae bacterium]|nr:murein L,D-transpeptidase catalytic domain family protein [Crocinitomicaceae bacterium]